MITGQTESCGYAEPVSGGPVLRGEIRVRVPLAARFGTMPAGVTRSDRPRRRGRGLHPAIAERLDICIDTVRKWRSRFCDSRFDGPRDLPRCGRPRRFRAEVVAEVKALACELQARADVPLTRWTCPDLAREVVTRGIADAISASTVRRWLADDAIKSWQYRSWIFPRDPYFASKAARVLDLYDRFFDGDPLGEDDFVLSADEKPGVQARRRKHLACLRTHISRCGWSPELRGPLSSSRSGPRRTSAKAGAALEIRLKPRWPL